MSLPLGEVNYLAVLVGAIINMAVGFVWYSRPVFGNLWMRLAGISEEQVEAGPGPAYILTFVASLVTALVLALLIITLDAGTFIEGLLAGVLVAVGFVATSNLATSVFNETHLGVWGIYAGYQVVTLAIVGGVLAIW